MRFVIQQFLRPKILHLHTRIGRFTSSFIAELNNESPGALQNEIKLAIERSREPNIRAKNAIPVKFSSHKNSAGIDNRKTIIATGKRMCFGKNGSVGYIKRTHAHATKRLLCLLIKDITINGNAIAHRYFTQIRRFAWLQKDVVQCQIGKSFSFHIKRDKTAISPTELENAVRICVRVYKDVIGCSGIIFNISQTNIGLNASFSGHNSTSQPSFRPKFEPGIDKMRALFNGDFPHGILFTLRNITVIFCRKLICAIIEIKIEHPIIRTVLERKTSSAGCHRHCRRKRDACEAIDNGAGKSAEFFDRNAVIRRSGKPISRRTTDNNCGQRSDKKCFIYFHAF